MYVPFITKSRRWTNFLRYRARKLTLRLYWSCNFAKRPFSLTERRRDGILIEDFGEQDAVRSGVTSGISDAAIKPRRMSTLPQCCEAIHAGAIPRSSSDRVGTEHQMSTGEAILQGAKHLHRTTLPSIAQVEDAMDKIPKLAEDTPSSTVTLRERRKFIHRIITIRSSSTTRPMISVNEDVHERKPNSVHKRGDASPSLTPTCGCFPPMALTDALRSLPRRVSSLLRFWPRGPTPAKSVEHSTGQHNTIPPTQAATVLPPPIRHPSGDSMPPRRSTSTADTHHQVHWRTSDYHDGPYVDSPTSGSPIQTRLPESRFYPCLTGHSDSEDDTGPFVVSFVS